MGMWRIAAPPELIVPILQMRKPELKKDEQLAGRARESLLDL